MTSASQELAASLDELVRGLPGVSALYRSGPLLAKIVAIGSQALRSDADGPLVRVESGDGAVSVTATIGVAAESATQTCRAVHDAIAAHLLMRGFDGAAIAVTVAHVDG